jgi:hypothetical protein
MKNTKIGKLIKKNPVVTTGVVAGATGMLIFPTLTTISLIGVGGYLAYNKWLKK